MPLLEASGAAQRKHYGILTMVLKYDISLFYCSVLPQTPFQEREHGSDSSPEKRRSRNVNMVLIHPEDDGFVFYP
jgi:hypothetical protein